MVGDINVDEVTFIEVNETFRTEELPATFIAFRLLSYHLQKRHKDQSLLANIKRGFPQWIAVVQGCESVSCLFNKQQFHASTLTFIERVALAIISERIIT